ncbi:alpha/beta fold hydrolase [Gordonia sp. HS-NH1]|uniref:alpha/beta fold hydrolase n=1 Tax=Gordonia sp. HS-NH1 TaxID=1435068 RepID=UPI0006E3DB0E|nr:alpha/beta hydrolase [Gordonia sp. HS-NH1]
MTLRHVRVRDGVEIGVRELGDGPGVLLIHGWSLSSEVWDRQIRVLAESGHRVVAMDLRGHGRSDAPLDGYDIDSLARDAAEVIEQCGLGPAAVVGWSLGGMVALRLACERPDLARSLVLVATNGVAAARCEDFPFGVPPDGPLESLLAAEHADRVTLRRRAVGDPFKGSPDRHVLDWLHRISLQTPSWAGRAALRTLMCTEQTRLLDDLSVPVTQIIGTADPALSVRGARWVRERLGSTLVEFDVGHYPMLECPDEFDAALLSGVRSVQAPVG